MLLTSRSKTSRAGLIFIRLALAILFVVALSSLVAKNNEQTWSVPNITLESSELQTYHSDEFSFEFKLPLDVSLEETTVHFPNRSRKNPYLLVLTFCLPPSGSEFCKSAWSSVFVERISKSAPQDAPFYYPSQPQVLSTTKMRIAGKRATILDVESMWYPDVHDTWVQILHNGYIITFVSIVVSPDPFTKKPAFDPYAKALVDTFLSTLQFR